jgi:hypothetical protein
VEERQCEEQTIGRCNTPRLDERQRVCREIAVRDDGALGGPRGAGRVDQRGGRVTVQRKAERRRVADASLGRQHIHLPDWHVGFDGRRSGDDERLRLRVAKDMSCVAFAIQDVDRDDDDAEARGGEEEIDVLDAVRQEDRQPVAGRHPAGR